MKKLIVFLAFLISSTIQSYGYDWTYIATVSNNLGGPKKTFYLWLPANSTGVRGVIMTSVARISQLSGDTSIRKACAEAEIGIMGCLNLDGNFKQEDTTYINNALAVFASQSKFLELNNIPLASYGTSTGGIFAWEVAFAYPGRFFAIIQDNAIYTKPPVWGTPGYRALDVPFIVSRGYNEEVGDKYWVSKDSVLSQRAGGGSSNLILKAGNGHFSWTTWEANYMAKWIKKAATARIPGGDYARTNQPTLLPVIEQSGWLTDTNFTSSPIAVSSYSNYTGDKSKAFWHFDQEMAQLWIQMHEGQFTKTSQLGQYNNSLLSNCLSPWQTCTTLNIGDSPVINPQAVSNASLPIRFGVYNGPFKAENNGSISLDPTLVDESSSGWIVAIQEGNQNYQGWEQAVKINVTKKNSGLDQLIIYTPTPDKFDTSSAFSTAFSSNSGLPVTARIKSGPAEWVGNQIIIKPFAGDSGAKATVVVRYGQPGNGNYKTAALATDTFIVTKTSGILNVNKTEKNEKPSFYPNPGKNTVFLKNAYFPERIVFISLAGKEVLTVQGKDITEGINVCGLQKGFYLVQYFSKGKSGTFSFIKE